MSIHPPYLKKGDKIAITCPAKKLPDSMTDAVTLLESWGLQVIFGETVTASYHQFAGDDNLRARDMQQFLDDDSIKAIIAARGGYGTVRIIDQLDFIRFAQYPKWVVGFSDITVLHSHIWANYATQTIHGQMPVNIKDGSSASLESLRKSLFGEAVSYEFGTHPQSRVGDAEGILIGGNLSLLVSVAGSVSDYNYDGCILFIEDVGEYLYAIDRMLYALKRAEKFKKLAGLVVGSFTDLKDNEIPFGQTVEQIIRAVVEEYDYPVCFNFPAGHITDNRALILGKRLSLAVSADLVVAKYV